MSRRRVLITGYLAGAVSVILALYVSVLLGPYSTRGLTVGTSRKLLAAGTVLGTVALVRIGVTLRGALSAHPDRTERLFLRLGYSPQPNEGEMLVVAYQYAFLRRSFPEFGGTAIEQKRTALLLWFAVFFVGVAIGLGGLVIAAVGD
jgi:hypothetical protein